MDLTMKQAAEVLNTSTWSVRKMRDEGLLHDTRSHAPGANKKYSRFAEAEVHALARERARIAAQLPQSTTPTRVARLPYVAPAAVGAPPLAAVGPTAAPSTPAMVTPLMARLQGLETALQELDQKVSRLLEAWGL